MDPFVLLFELFGRYFWLISLAFGLQALRPSPRLRDRIAAEPSFADEHRALRRKVLLWLSIPWFVMGAGQLIGGVPYVWNYFRPQDRNPWVLLFFASGFALWIVAAKWVYLGDGARKIAEHQLIAVYGPWGASPLTASRVKLSLGLGLLGGIAGVIMMFIMDVPIPKFVP